MAGREPAIAWAALNQRNQPAGDEMTRNVSGKTVLIVQGSLLSGSDLEDAFTRSGARVYLTTNIISAFGLLRRIRFDGAVVDQGLHNAAFDLCSELHDVGVPYICCASPHRLQKPGARIREAEHAVRRLDDIISSTIQVPPGFAGLQRLATSEMRT
jgi:hypothetical protein